MTVRLEELMAAATPGPWDHTADALVAAFSSDGKFPDVKLGHSIVAGCESWNDASLIALAPDMARLLIDMSEAIEAYHQFAPHKSGCGIYPLMKKRDCDCGRKELDALHAALLARLDTLGNTKEPTDG